MVSVCCSHESTVNLLFLTAIMIHSSDGICCFRCSFLHVQEEFAVILIAKACFLMKT